MQCKPIFIAYQRGDYATALRLWHPLAELGDADAQFHLGGLFSEEIISIGLALPLVL